MGSFILEKSWMDIEMFALTLSVDTQKVMLSQKFYCQDEQIADLQKGVNQYLSAMLKEKQVSFGCIAGRMKPACSLTLSPSKMTGQLSILCEILLDYGEFEIDEISEKCECKFLFLTHCGSLKEFADSLADLMGSEVGARATLTGSGNFETSDP